MVSESFHTLAAAQVPDDQDGSRLAQILGEGIFQDKPSP